MNRPVSAVFLAILLLLAGCIGDQGAAGPGTEGTPTVDEPTNSPPDSTPSPTPLTINSSRVVAYQDLNSQQQSAFREALHGEVTFVPNSSYIDDAEGYHIEHLRPFRTHDYVRYDGELYRIRRHGGELYASYEIEASRGTPGDDEMVIAFESLPTDIQDEVRTAIIEGEYYAPTGKWRSLPAPLRDADYIRYENQTYAMVYTVGDAYAEVMSVEKIE